MYVCILFTTCRKIKHLDSHGSPKTYTAAVQPHIPGQQFCFGRYQDKLPDIHTYIHINIHARILSKWKNRRLSTPNIILCV